jgi:hypothetical protein
MRLAAVIVELITSPRTLKRAMKVGKRWVISAICTQVFIAHKKPPLKALLLCPFERTLQIFEFGVS